MDLDDLEKVIPIDDMMRLAKQRGPMGLKDEAATERLIEGVFGNLEALIAEMGEMGREQRSKAVAKVLRDEARLRWLAMGAHRHPGRWRAIRLELEQLDRSGHRMLRDAVEAVAKGLLTSGTQSTRYKDLTDRGLMPPPGFTVDGDGVWSDDESEPVASRPIFITGRSQDITREAARYLKLRWGDGEGGHDEMVLSRQHAMDSRGLQRIAAGAGAPVTSANALRLTRYLDAFETSNAARLPLSLVTTRLGWQPNGSFMLGSECFGEGEVDLAEPERADGWRTGGTWNGWLTAYQAAADRPLMVLAVIASCAAPLLTTLSAAGFVIDWSGQTSVGKTTALRMAASVWGDPSASSGPMGSWKSASSAGPMAAAAYVHSLPLILDDTKDTHPEIVKQVLYAVPSGIDRLRADREGNARAQRTWRTILLSSGESPVLSMSQDGGARARTLGLKGPPMGPSTAANAAKAKLVSRAIAEHHGHLGRRVIAEVLENPEHYRSVFALRRHDRAAGLAGVEDRVADHLAVLDTALEVALAAGLPEPKCAAVDHAADCVSRSAEQGDPVSAALRALFAEAASNPHRFEGRAVRQDPSAGYIGVWPDGAWSEIALKPQWVCEQLTRWGYDSASVLEGWRDRGWLRTDRSRGNPRVMFHGARVRLLVIRRKAFDMVDDGLE